MTEQNHPWCRDVRRDEAVRAAEDAANWRRLEVGEVVQAGDEYRNCWGWQPVPTAWCGQALGDGFWPVRRRIPSAPQHRDLPEVVADLRERVARLEAAAPPRGWLTAEERDAVRWIIDFARHNVVPSAAVAHCHIETANALLARETPPRVRKPNPNVVITTVDARERIDRQWIAAIRAAGGEVEG